MTKGRAPIPAHLKLLRGNPGQYRVMPEPTPEAEAEPPPPPSFVTGYAAEEWQRIAVELHRLGLLTKVDVTALAGYCRTYARWRKAEETLELMAADATDLLDKGGEINPLIKVSQDAAAQMLKFAVEFGLTPVSRARFSVDPKRQQKSKFEKLLAG